MTVVPINKAGKELRRAIMWMDVRATKQMERVMDMDHWARLYNGGKTTPPHRRVVSLQSGLATRK